LVVGPDTLVDQVVPGPGHRPQGSGLVAEGLQPVEPVASEPQVFGDDLGVAGIRFGARDHLGFPPCLDGVGRHRHYRVTGFEQPVDQTSVRPLDRHPDRLRLAQLAQPGDETIEAVSRVLDREAGQHPAARVHCAHRMLFAGPVDPDQGHRSIDGHRTPRSRRTNKLSVNGHPPVGH
jgi:hypothetical protein